MPCSSKQRVVNAQPPCLQVRATAALSSLTANGCRQLVPTFNLSGALAHCMISLVAMTGSMSQLRMLDHA
jgi:hypothetical protein